MVLRVVGDVGWAIRLCKSHNQQDLWARLIDHAIDKPGEPRLYAVGGGGGPRGGYLVHFIYSFYLITEFIRELLNNIGTHIDPLLIIQRIPKEMEIPGLRDALVKIMQDYHLQVKCFTVQYMNLSYLGIFALVYGIGPDIVVFLTQEFERKM